jgi:hypothetical protein
MRIDVLTSRIPVQPARDCSMNVGWYLLGINRH